MSHEFKTDNPELEALFERYQRSPRGYVFAPLADTCRKAGMLEEAIEICEKGVSTHPGYASGYVVRGKCYYDIGNADQAEASFEKVLELDGNNLVALKYLGLILAERGQLGDARRRFEHILELDPDDREIRAKLDEIGESDAGIDAALASELNDVLGADDGADASEAETVELREVEDEGFTGAEITLGDGRQTADVLATITLADIYASQGYRRKAIKIYTELLDAQPGNSEIRKKLRELGVDRASGVAAPAAAPVVTDDAPVENEPDAEAAPVQPSTPPADIPADTPVDGDGGTRPQPRPTQPSPPQGETRNAAHFKRWLENFTR